MRGTGSVAVFALSYFLYMFSVVIPTYNHAEFLETALKSVLDQTFRDFEVIVVNNYSTDDTLSVIERLGDPRVQVINFRNHGVIGASRNVGIKASQAPYVAFLDSDDTWEVSKLAKIAETAQMSEMCASMVEGVKDMMVDI